jgi:hypothetical protein
VSTASLGHLHGTGGSEPWGQQSAETHKVQLDGAWGVFRCLRGCCYEGSMWGVQATPRPGPCPHPILVFTFAPLPQGAHESLHCTIGHPPESNAAVLNGLRVLAAGRQNPSHCVLHVPCHLRRQQGQRSCHHGCPRSNSCCT